MCSLCFQLLQYRSEVKSLSHVQLFVTPWTVACQAPLSMGFSRQEYWSGLPFPSPGDLPNSGIEPRSPALQADALFSEPPGKSGIHIFSLNLSLDSYGQFTQWPCKQLKLDVSKTELIIHSLVISTTIHPVSLQSPFNLHSLSHFSSSSHHFLTWTTSTASSVTFT